ncbi:hypothetical protein QYM36_009609 [Artemia franciscana]|uniref:Uncharacterized protein n=1 Tax=Artemia franciscana TaxID=6661 RepID=A0AA88HTZ8_ARTSF|nr:hypothetical protein QYM36_009609 [Artemia franciscana]
MIGYLMKSQTRTTAYRETNEQITTSEETNEQLTAFGQTAGQVTVLGATDGLTANSVGNPFRKHLTSPSQTDDRPVLCKRLTTRIGTLNLRKLAKPGQKDMLFHEANRYKWDIIGLSEHIYQQAFDLIWRGGLRHILNIYGIPFDITDIITSIYEKAKSKV